MAERYLRARRSGWEPSTYTNRWCHLRNFALACPDLPDEPEPIEDFLGTVAGALYRYGHWCTIRNFYLWAAKRHGAHDPCPMVDGPSKPPAEPYWLEPDQLQQLLSYPHSKRDGVLLWVLADTGMRRGEAHSMRREGMRANAAGQGGWVQVWGKTRKQTGSRWVPVSQHVWDMLMGIAPESGPIWRGKRGPIGVQALGYIVWCCFHRAGLVGDKMSAHRLRHTFATLWTGTDGDGMDVIGHRDYRTWRLYKHARPKRLSAVHAEHSPITQLGLPDIAA
jgi:integrase